MPICFSLLSNFHGQVFLSWTSDKKSLECLLPKLLSCLINTTVRLSCSVNKLVRREKWTMVLNLAFLRPKHKGQASGSTPGQPLLPSTFQNFVFRGKNCHSVSSVTALTKKEKTLFFFPKQWQPQSKTWQVFIGGHYFRPREVYCYFKVFGPWWKHDNHIITWFVW